MLVSERNQKKTLCPYTSKFEPKFRFPCHPSHHTHTHTLFRNRTGRFSHSARTRTLEWRREWQGDRGNASHVERQGAARPAEGAEPGPAVERNHRASRACGRVLERDLRVPRGHRGALRVPALCRAAEDGAAPQQGVLPPGGVPRRAGLCAGRRQDVRRVAARPVHQHHRAEVRGPVRGAPPAEGGGPPGRQAVHAARRAVLGSDGRVGEERRRLRPHHGARRPVHRSAALRRAGGRGAEVREEDAEGRRADVHPPFREQLR